MQNYRYSFDSALNLEQLTDFVPAAVDIEVGFDIHLDIVGNFVEHHSFDMEHQIAADFAQQEIAHFAQTHLDIHHSFVVVDTDFEENYSVERHNFGRSDSSLDLVSYYL